VHNTHAEMNYTDLCDDARLVAVGTDGAVSLQDASGWTRFYGDAGRRLASVPPGWRRCGSMHTGWLATSHPPMGAAPREGTVCFQTGADSSLACAVTAVAYTCACSYDGGASLTYAYRFFAPWACPAAYCATDEGLDEQHLRTDGTAAPWPPATPPLSPPEVHQPPHAPSPPPSPPWSQMPPPPPRPPPPPPPLAQNVPPSPPPMPPSGWCHSSCPQDLNTSTTTLDGYWRSVDNVYAYKHSYEHHSGPVVAQYNRYTKRCDRTASAYSPMAGHALGDALWYAFSGEAGTQMPISPPQHEACGTTSPGWLATEHPRPGDPPRYGLVCFRNVAHDDSCRDSIEVRVCACSYDGGVVTSYTYKLPQPPTCDMAYCGTHVLAAV